LDKGIVAKTTVWETLIARKLIVDGTSSGLSFGAVGVVFECVAV